MKNLLITAIAAVAALPALANHPDSVYVRPDVKNGTRDMQIAYSVDKKHWTHIDCNLFESDYGAWGSEKKLHYPVLTYDGKQYKATFIPNPKVAQIATTQSDNFTLWKPQDYPYIDKEGFKDVLDKQQKESADNIIRIPYSDLQRLMDKQKMAEQNAAWERENFMVTGRSIADKAEGINATMTVNWNDRKAISPNLMGIFFEDISYAADGGLYAELIQNRDFEYIPDDNRGKWDAKTAWRLEGSGTQWSISTDQPIHKNNAH